MRRSENDFVVEQMHDVVAWLSVCELSAEGKYAPVPVVSTGHLDPGSFSLHQGLQRKLQLTLSSNSGKQLPWVAVTKLKVGNVRLFDPKGRIHESESRELVEVKIHKQQAVEFRPDGTGTLTIEAPWDSSAHESPLLNRVTANGQRILLQVQWWVDIDTCLDPVQFSMDMAITMRARDAGGPSRFAAIFNSTKHLSKSSAIFTLKLTPPLTRSAKDLWRLDTSEKYVRGEELLTGWKPRGISVVEDYERLVATEKRSADVQAIKVILAASPPHPYSGGKSEDELTQEALKLWQKRFGHRGRDPEDEDTEAAAVVDPNLSEPLKMVAQVKLVPRTNTPTKSGNLLLLTNAHENTWKKIWFVLRRPHLFMYQHSNEVDEVGVISLKGVKVEQSKHMEPLLG
ncbi:kinesin-like protein Klp8, partial [Serendipita sp. 399]